MFCKTWLLVLTLALFLSNVLSTSLNSKKNKSNLKKLQNSYQEKNCSSSLVGKSLCTSCTSYKVCMTSNQEFPSNSCPSDTPYCVQTATQAVCASQPDLQQVVCRNIMNMPKPINCEFGFKYIPDPKFCNYYHYCARDGQQSTVYPCPENQYFNETTRTCASNSTQKCNVVRCSTDSLFSMYGDGFNRWYGYCDTTNNNITMFKCRPSFKMNFKTSICEFVCPKQGNAIFCDRDDDSIYYECTGPENSWDQKIKIKQCPPRTLFNYAVEECTDSDSASMTHMYPRSYRSCRYTDRV